MGDRKSESGRRRGPRRPVRQVGTANRAARRRPHAVAGAAIGLVLVVLPASSCTNEEVISVEIATVRVTPTTASAIEGEDVQLTATVLDENHIPLDGATVTWSSQDTSLVSVDTSGTVRTRATGVTTVRAAFGGASGEATIRVLPGPEIAVSRDSVPLFAGAAGGPPDSETVLVTNNGGASLEDVSVRVEHPPESPAAWLHAALDGTSLPADLTLTADPEGLPAGTYAATVVITAPAARNSPVSIPVTLSLTGFTLRESGEGTSVSESGSEDTFTVVLDLKPASDVVLTVTSADPGEVEVTPRTLTFAPDAWDAPRTVTVKGVDDDDVDGPQVTLVTVVVDEARSDEVFGGLPGRSVSVTTTDDDAPNLRVVQSGDGTSVDESGTTDEFSVELTARPASDVRIDVVSADPEEASVAPPSLTFTRSNWNDARTVTVTGVDDLLLDGDQTTAITLSVNDAESDDAFHGVPDHTVTVTTTDDDQAGFTVTESGGTTVTEAGGTDDLRVVLAARPSSDVVLRSTSADAGEMAVAPAAVTFTPENWDAVQILTVTGVDDAVADGDQVTTLTVSVDRAASDDAFDAFPDRSLDVTTTDDDDAGLTVRESGSGTSVTEAAGTDDFTVALGSEPLSNVVVDVTSGDPGEATAGPASLTFTPATWATPQTVSVTGVDDATVDGPQATSVTVSVRSDASDPAFAATPDETVIVTTTDDDVPGFTVTQTGGTSVTEPGGTDELTVVLTAQPESSVVLAVTSGDVGEAVVSPGTLTFTSASWSSAQTVTVMGVDDAVVDGDQVATLTIAVDDGASDDAFDGVADQTVDVTNADDDIAGFVVTESDGTTVVTEAGDTDDLRVVLLAQPLADVVLSLTASDPGEATVSPVTLTFTPADWSAPQAVTVTGVDDLLLDGDQVSTITIGVDDVGSDDAFDGVADQSVSVTTRDRIIIIGAGAASTGLGNGPTAAYRRNTAIASPYE